MSLKVNIFKDLGSFKLDVNFETKDVTLALLGTSGCGKSMTLKCIAGIEKPDYGYIELNGRVLFDSENKINLSPQKRKVGYLFQDFALFPNMNVYQNIKCGLKNYPKEKRDERIKELVNIFHLDGLEKHKPHQLSGGQKQRTALARILASNPELLLLDEPFSSLDEHLRTGLQIEMKQIIKDFNGDVILVTHNRDEAYILSDEMCILDNGHAEKKEKTKELFDNPETVSSAIITGCKNIASVEIKDKTIVVPSWGISFKCPKEIKECTSIGVRAHSFSLDKKTMSFPIEIIDIIEEPFEHTIRFRFANNNCSSILYWRLSKSEKIDLKTKKIYLSEKDILFLK